MSIALVQINKAENFDNGIVEMEHPDIRVLLLYM